MSKPHHDLSAVLRVVCKDRPGLVADLAGLLYRLGVNIIHADQHKDPENGLFFQRVEFALPPGLAATGRQEFAAAVADACNAWGMDHSLRFTDHRRRTAILVSRHGHCALDLLQRHRAGELACDVPVVISNHPDLANEVTRRGYHFVHEPIHDGNKQEQEQRILRHLAEHRIDLVVLARYMQILSPQLVAAWPERIINIHHSFLPAFAGADPYRKAFGRGVKLVGATSHYVTSELDEGPIISQDVTRVTHRDTVADMERKGRDLERIVLAHAVRCHIEDRVIAYDGKTVVFE